MTIENKLDEIIAVLATTATPVDISGLATAAEVAALSAQITALAAVVGTETTPAPTPVADAAPVAESTPTA